jgi:hypothetical protein
MGQNAWHGAVDGGQVRDAAGRVAPQVQGARERDGEVGLGHRAGHGPRGQRHDGPQNQRRQGTNINANTHTRLWRAAAYRFSYQNLARATASSSTIYMRVSSLSLTISAKPNKLLTLHASCL